MAGHDLFLLIRGPTINPFPTCSLATSQLVASENMSPKITSNLLKHLTPDMNMKEKQTSGVVFPTGMEVPSGSSIRSHRQNPLFPFMFGGGRMLDQEVVYRRAPESFSILCGPVVNHFPHDWCFFFFLAPNACQKERSLQSWDSIHHQLWIDTRWTRRSTDECWNLQTLIGRLIDSRPIIGYCRFSSNNRVTPSWPVHGCMLGPSWLHVVSPKREMYWRDEDVT